MENIFYKTLDRVSIVGIFFIAIIISLKLVFKFKYRYKNKFINLVIILLYLITPFFIIVIMDKYTFIEPFLIILSSTIFMKILFDYNIKIILLDILVVSNLFITSLIFSNLFFIILNKFIVVKLPEFNLIVAFIENYPKLYVNVIFILIFAIISVKSKINSTELFFLESFDKKINKLLILEVLIFLLYLFIVKAFVTSMLLGSTIDISFSVLEVLLALYISYILYVAVADSAQKSYLQYLYNTIESQFENQMNHYIALENYIRNTRMIVHDTKHHVLVLNTLINKNLIEEATLYINDLQSDLFRIENEKICDNKVIESIIQSYIFDCSSKDIDLRYNVEVPNNLNIDNRDLAIIFGNLLSNAVEATSNIKNTSIKKFIEININTVNNKLIVNIINSKENKTISFGNIFKTTKYDKNNHGIGLSSVNQSILKYNGHINFHDLENTFKVSFFIPLK